MLHFCHKVIRSFIINFILLSTSYCTLKIFSQYNNSTLPHQLIEILNIKVSLHRKTFVKKKKKKKTNLTSKLKSLYCNTNPIIYLQDVLRLFCL